MKQLITFLLFLNISQLAFAQGVTMQHSLSSEVPLKVDTKNVKVLTAGTFKLIGLAFKKNQVLEKHKTPTPAVLIVQSGSVDFNMAGKSFHLKAGDYFEIPADIEHEVIGKEDSHLFLVK